MATTPQSKQLVAALKRIADPAAVPGVARFFHSEEGGNRTRFLGVSIGKVFPVAKQFATMPVGEIEALLEGAYYEVRMAAVAVMDFQARSKRTSSEQRKELFDLYLRRHDRIDNWDLVDRAAPWVVGGWLADKPRGVLYRLAASPNPWERRTAIVSTYYFIRQDDLDDTFRIAALLARDNHEPVQKAAGSWIREAGKRDGKRLLRFLDEHAASMPKAMLRYAVEKLAPAVKNKYMR